MNSLRLKKIIDKILNEALLYQGLFSSDPNEHKVKRALKSGEKLPEECMPGKIIEKLSPEERAVLKTATEKDFYHRIK